MGMRSGGGGPLSVKDMRDALQGLADDVEFDFGSTTSGDRLVFYRFKWRGEKLLQIELNEMSAEDERLDKKGEDCLTALRTLLKSSQQLSPASVDDIAGSYLSEFRQDAVEQRKLLAREFRGRTGPSARREFIYARLLGRIP